MDVLISAEELADDLAQGVRPRLLDIRWRLGGPPGRPLYLQAHIPSAVYVDLDTELAAPASTTEGRHPLPEIDRLTASARRWGLNDGDRVVVYDERTSTAAARAWWLLRFAGVPDVRILNRGFAAWVDAGFDVASGEEVAQPGRITLAYGAVPVLSIDDAAVLPERGVLLDARAGERYRGESEPLDPRPGHIPGALSAPTTENVDASGRFLSPDELRTRFAFIGVRPDAPLGVYCGSGITAAHEAAALTIAGFEPALYPGSYSQWSNDPRREVELGSVAR